MLLSSQALILNKRPKTRSSKVKTRAIIKNCDTIASVKGKLALWTTQLIERMLAHFMLLSVFCVLARQ
jgi:hypothetical protein